MMTQSNGQQLKLHCVTIEDLVPSNHFLRTLNATVDFSFIYDEVRDLYSANRGRPGIDPVVLVKYLLLGYLYGISSERQIEEHCRDRNSFRWFLGLDIDERVPDHSTISQNRRRRFRGKNLYRCLFERVLEMCIEKGLVDGRLIITDSTHVKANASRKSEYRMLVEKEAAWYMERLDRYEELEREKLEELGKIRPKQTRRKKQSNPELAEKTVSSTDPESGKLNRPGKPEGMHYLDHQSIDAKNGIIVDVAVTPGNVTDATPYLDRVDHIREHIGLKIEIAGVDSAYDVSLVHQELAEKGIRLITPINNDTMNYKVELQKSDFIYNEQEDVFVCPQGKRLPLRRLQRSENNICREYRADRKDCKECPIKHKCLPDSQPCRRIQVNIFESAVRSNHKGDGTPEHKGVLALRQTWCEGTFAVQKARHNLRSLFRRGLEAAEDHCLLAATVVNLKRMVKCLG
jgi:transposase